MEQLLLRLLPCVAREIMLLLNDGLFIAFVTLLTTHLLINIGYLIYMSKASQRPWNLQLSEEYEPSVTIIVPAYKETRVIKKKIENIAELDYPKHKLQVIIIGDAETLEAAKEQTHLLEGVKMMLIEEKERLGKARALNHALKFAEGEIIATSDADAMWSRDALRNAVKYFNDPRVAAVTGHEIIANAYKNIHTYSEHLYRKTYYVLRLGESKISSTMIFQGELALYRRSYLGFFENRPGYSDDTGTVIRLIKEGRRCIYVPDAKFTDNAPPTLKDKIKLKSRRGQHLITALTEALKYKIKKEFPLPLYTVLANYYIHVLSPIMQCAIPAFLLASLLRNTVITISLIIVAILIISMLSRRVKALVELYIISTTALLTALMKTIIGMRTATWGKIESMRGV
jgi:cellulose synthase/poly-beta-1,6-N-acetylglucosamine synthase-like glycosyltransferase